jgi:hypothetical protein
MEEPIVEDQTVQEASAIAAIENEPVETYEVVEAQAEDTLRKNETATAPVEEAPKQVLTQEQFRDYLKAQKAQQKHQLKIEQDRQIRRSQPFSNAKIEDLNEIVEMVQARDNDLFILTKTLFKLGLIKESDIVETRAYEQTRAVKFSELISPESKLTEEEKFAVATEWHLPLGPLGLQEPSVPTE